MLLMTVAAAAAVAAAMLGWRHCDNDDNFYAMKTSLRDVLRPNKLDDSPSVDVRLMH
jgi:hypothetical protein